MKKEAGSPTWATALDLTEVGVSDQVDAEPWADFAGDLREVECRRNTNSSRWDYLASDISASRTRTCQRRRIASFVARLGADSDARFPGRARKRSAEGPAFR